MTSFATPNDLTNWEKELLTLIYIEKLAHQALAEAIKLDDKLDRDLYYSKKKHEFEKSFKESPTHIPYSESLLAKIRSK